MALEGLFPFSTLTLELLQSGVTIKIRRQIGDGYLESLNLLE